MKFTDEKSANKESLDTRNTPVFSENKAKTKAHDFFVKIIAKLRSLLPANRRLSPSVDNRHFIRQFFFIINKLVARIINSVVHFIEVLFSSYSSPI